MNALIQWLLKVFRFKAIEVAPPVVDLSGAREIRAKPWFLGPEGTTLASREAGDKLRLLCRRHNLSDLVQRLEGEALSDGTPITAALIISARNGQIEPIMIQELFGIIVAHSSQN